MIFSPELELLHRELLLLLVGFLAQEHRQQLLIQVHPWYSFLLQW
jgi:hypothetical protein